MRKLGYESYKDVQENFSWGESWDIVDSTPDSVNTTHECIDRHAGTGEAVRIKFADGSTATHTFSSISSATAQFANFLEDTGVEKGSRVAIMLNPSFEFMVGFFGTMKRGATAVPCSELFGPKGLRYRIENTEPEVLITSEGVADSIDTSLVDKIILHEDLSDTIEGYSEEYSPTTKGKDVAWIQHTSGTTGRPEAHEYHHESTVYWAPVLDFVLDFQPDDSGFSTASTGWGMGIWGGLYGPLIYGVPTGFRSGKFDPALVLEAFEEFDINTIVASNPTAFEQLLSTAEELDEVPQLDKMVLGGEPMDAELSRRIEEVFEAFPRQRYGATELRSNVSLDYAYPDHEFKHGSMGRPLPGLDVRIVDEDGTELPTGEVGYIELKRSDEWMRSSDAAYMDEDGYLWSAGRMDDTIISAGYTIGPHEVEDSIRSHPDVIETGVIGVPDDERGEIVKAYVVADGEPTDGLIEDIQAHVRDRLSKHEYPREIEFVDSIPQTTNGKTKRKDLREIEGLE